MPVPITMYLKCPKCGYKRVKQIGDASLIESRLCPKCHTIMQKVEQEDFLESIAKAIKDLVK